MGKGVEAARLQAFPDWYFAEIDKLGIKKGHLYKIIGDAVPSLLVDPVIKSLFASFEKKFAKRSN